MRKIFQSLGEHKGAIFLIVLLLIVEAWCDLSLPQYTSDIVDVGIQQGGIENAAPDEIRGSTFDSLSVFMTVRIPRRLPAILSIPSVKKDVKI